MKKEKEIAIHIILDQIDDAFYDLEDRADIQDNMEMIEDIRKEMDKIRKSIYKKYGFEVK